MDQATVARFWAKLNLNGPVPQHAPHLGPCWLWTAAPGENGYGYFWHDGKKRLAHRFSYQLFVGPIPDGLVIDHLCRVQICERPDHLEPVTDRVNILRGIAPPARNVVAVECSAGHPFDEANTYWYPSGERACRECMAVWNREWREKNDPPTGVGKGGWQAAKTHCPAGHEYSPQNTYSKPGGGRACRTCVRTRNREAQRRKRAAAK